jgi:hypothetical protein
MCERLAAHSILVVIGLMLAVLGIVAGPAGAGQPLVSFKVAKHATGPYKETGVRVDLAAGDARNAYLEVRALGDESVAASLAAAGDLEGYRVKYFKANGTDVTNQVTNDGFDFDAKSSKRLDTASRSGGSEAPRPTVP